ncbi:MAG: hydrogenase expression/formation protein HypE [Myxococcota bacterium]
MNDDDFVLSCPVPFAGYERVVLAHGGGGRVMQRLILELFVEAFDDDALREGLDGATVPTGARTVITTDAFVVSPLFFPGGDIGNLSVHGTVNDLCAAGAAPRYLAASFVIEEGLPMDDLRRIVQSMAAAARRCGTRIVAGDTKVVERGKGDGVFITTTGLGELLVPDPPAPARVRPGDAVLVTGPVGDHGVAVMLQREGIGIESSLESDSAPVLPQLRALAEAGVPLACLRDPTRGGLATVLNEIAMGAGVGVRVEEDAVPVRAEVADACELMGLDPLYVACEGRLVVFVPEDHAGRALAALRATPGSEHAARIGRVVAEHPGGVVLESGFGSGRILDLLAGEQLPRIC